MKRVLALSVLSGILYAAAQPPLDLSALAFVALVPLLAASVTSSPRMRILAGAVAGTVAGLGCVGTSVYEAARLYFAQPAWASALFAVLVPLVYGAPYFALFALVAGPSCRDRKASVHPLVVVSAAWAASEYARANVGHGTPWCLLAHSQMHAPALLQPAALGGAFAVSFVLALANAAVFACLQASRRRLPVRVVLGRLTFAGLVVAGVLLHGRRELARWTVPPGNALRVAVVQPNVPAEWRHSLVRVPEILGRLARLTRIAAEDGPALVVWPENAVGFAVEANALSLRDAGNALPEGASLIVGAPRSVEEAGSATFRNAAFLVDRSGTVRASQDKRRLTPFAEYWPAWLPRPAGRDDAYRPGDRIALLDVNGTPVGVLICSESIYPDLARGLVGEGAELLVNISNDAWFGESPAPLHHLNAVRLRAIELRRFVVRSTNTGLSAVVAPSGALTAELAPSEEAVVVADVVPIDEKTPYARFGDLFAWVAIAVVAADLLRRHFTGDLGRSRREW